jgi:dTDP-4-amino-4,6-dideoxygalactose transaminase
MSELQGAVAVAQLDKLPSVVTQRVAAAGRLAERLQPIEGIELPWVEPGNVHTYWKYCLRVDGGAIPGGVTALGRFLKERGISSAPRYIQKPAFACAVFREQRTFGTSRWPFTLARPEALDYSPARFLGTFTALEGVLVLPWNERYTEEHLNYLTDSICEGVAHLRGGG